MLSLSLAHYVNDASGELTVIAEGADHDKMVQVWVFKGDPIETQEDLFAYNGMIFAYCTDYQWHERADDTFAQRVDGLRRFEDPSDIEFPTAMLAAGFILGGMSAH